MLMYFTSGTTGNPKMAVHDFSYPIGAHSSPPSSGTTSPLTVCTSQWRTPVGPNAPGGKTYGQYICGAAQFVYDFDKFVPNDLLKMIERHKVTSFCAPPTVFRFFYQTGDGKLRPVLLEYVTTAGEALNAEVFNRFKEYTGLNIMEGFGQTESTMLANMVPPSPGLVLWEKPVPLYAILTWWMRTGTVEPRCGG